MTTECAKTICQLKRKINYTKSVSGGHNSKAADVLTVKNDPLH